MELQFDANMVVPVIGFCLCLGAYPVWMRFLPLGAAILFPLYPVESAFTAYVTVLFLGTVYELIAMGLSFAGGAERSF